MNCKDFIDKLVGINVDGASINLGKRKGMGTLLKENLPWIIDAFRTTSFEEVDSMLCKLYYIYQKSPKRISELKELSKAYEKTVPKPIKATGTLDRP